MTRWLLLLLLAVLVWQGLERIVGALRAGGQLGPTSPEPGRRSPERPVETLVRCAACGTHVPRARALTGTDAESYCSPECRANGPRGPRTA